MLDSAYTFVLREEGGFVDNPNDPGGRTNFGVTQNVYDASRKKDVKNITPPEVKKIYAEFWLRARADLIADYSPELATVHFDAAINSGPAQAAKFLQRAIGVIADGHIGPQTLALMKSQSPRDVIRLYMREREIFYINLILRRPTSLEFLKGWLFRLRKLRYHINVVC